MRIFAVSRRTQIALVVAAAALPRLVVLAAERGNILSAYTEKSDTFAQTFVASGTFGFVAGHPSADTQPLYGFFLVPLYWIFGRHWLVVGLAQITVAVGTALLVYAIALRVVPRLAALAAIVATLNPYLVWHDVHVNREILDQLVLAALVLATLLAVERRSIRWFAVVGALGGVAILGNARLAALPLVLAAYLLIECGRRYLVAAVLMVVVSAALVSPWVIRNRVSVGCFALTTDGRALWKANNGATYRTLAGGGWIDDVPQPRSFPLSAEAAAVYLEENGTYPPTDECAQMTHFEHLAAKYVVHHPVEKLRLMGQAAYLLWDPQVHETQGRSGKGSWRDELRRIGEPVWLIPVILLAALGLIVGVNRVYARLALVLLAYNTVAAMVFAGTTRYRVPYDFLLVPLAAAGFEWLFRRLRYTAATPSAVRAGEN